MKETHGKDVLPTLAERYQQLYLIPGDEGAEQYKAIVREQIDAVWDELVELFLGVDAQHYVGGRLENYVDAPDDAEKTRRLDAFAPVLHGILGKFENNALEQRGIPPLELSLIYESGYTDEAFNLIDDETDAYPLYEDLREIAHILVKNGDRERVKKIFDLMADYAERNPDTIEQLCSCRMIRQYHMS